MFGKAFRGVCGWVLSWRGRELKESEWKSRGREEDRGEERKEGKGGS